MDQTFIDSKPVFGPPRPPPRASTSPGDINKLEDNFILRVQLCPDRIVSPPIIRTLSCPAKATFHHIHLALQIAFGWSSTHAYDFMVKDPSVTQASPTMEDLIAGMARGPLLNAMPNMGPKALLRLAEDYESEEHSRRFGPIGMSMDRMHERMRRHNETPEKRSNLVHLIEVFGNPKLAGHEFEYSYDFGDNWWHKIEVVGRRSASNVFKCVSGQGDGAAEDVGS